MTNKVLIDTDILVDYLRGQKQASDYLENEKKDLFVSAINVAEIYAGIRDSEEMYSVKEFLAIFKIIDIGKEIAENGGLLRRDYLKSHGIGLSDAIIAASAFSIDAIVATLNKKHYPMLNSNRILVPYQK